nr:glycosyltransferase family 4 protein [uncultured Desulfobacter sp.]
MKKSIAHIVTRFPSVSETFVVADIHAMKMLWHENHVFAFFKNSGDVPDWITKVHYFPVYRLYLKTQLYFFFKNPRQYISLFAYVMSGHASKKKEMVKAFIAWPKMVHAAYVAKKAGIESFHAHWSNMPATTAFIISRLLDRSFSCTGHAHDLYKFNAFLHDVLKHCRLFLTSTRYNKQYLASTYPDVDQSKIKVYSHGVDVRLMSPGKIPSKPPFFFLSIGRMTWQKGFDTLFRALRILIDDGVPVRLDFLGLPGHTEKEIRRLCRDLKLNDHVQWLEACSQNKIVELYRSAHAFVLPCQVGPHGDRDGIPNVILEASACGLPCISTRVSGVPEAVIHGKTGLLVQPCDPKALAGAMKRLCEDEPLRRELGISARQFIEKNYDRKVCHERIISLMETYHG